MKKVLYVQCVILIGLIQLHVSGLVLVINDIESEVHTYNLKDWKVEVKM
jgi:hypothetical protein